MYKIGEDEMVFCPYNRYHVVSKLRIQKHIIKCKKNYPDVKLAACFYNYTHRVRPEDMLQHYEICSQKTRIDGCRYSEPYCLTSSSSSMKSGSFIEKFPDIDIKPRIFTEAGICSSASSQTLGNGGESDSESKGGNDSDDDLDPLPIPKSNPLALSKVSVNVQKKTGKFDSVTSHSKIFGRGKNLCAFSQPKQSGSSYHLSLDSKNAESARKSQNKLPVLFQNGNSTSITSSVLKNFDASKSQSTLQSKDGSASVTSSMFDDNSTLKSEEIIFDEEFSEIIPDEEENGNDGFIFTNFHKYVKI